MQDIDMGRIQQVFIVTYEKKLSADCALELSASTWVLCTQHIVLL